MIELPKPPGPLTSEGKYFYKNVGEYLIENNLLHKVDTTLLYTGASWWSIFCKSQAEIAKPDFEYVIYHDTVHQSSSPYIGNLLKANTALANIFTKLGVGEQARQKLKMMDGAGGEDPMDKLGM